MNDTKNTPSLEAPSPDESPSARRNARLRFGVFLTVTIAVLAYLVWPCGRPDDAGSTAAREDAEPAVRIARAGHLRIAPDTPLFRRLETSIVQPRILSEPAMTVTGTVVASLRPSATGVAQWQFSTPELLSTFTEWQKALADIAFARRQLDSIRQLSANRVDAQSARVDRLAKLVAAGTDSENDLATARTELLQARIEGQKDVHEAETAVRMAERAEAALGRQLQQEGLDPELLRTSDAKADIVVAEVPEAFVSRVRLGQGCEARFLGVGEQRFPGTIRAISPVLSNERRSLRVLFTIADPDDRLRPGLYADIGLGTDARDALLAPVAGVVHAGRSDYLLVRSGADEWEVSEVLVGEMHGAEVEILDGLEAGAEVVGKGAILLKPFIQDVVRGECTGNGRGVNGPGPRRFRHRGGIPNGGQP